MLRLENVSIILFCFAVSLRKESETRGKDKTQKKQRKQKRQRKEERKKGQREGREGGSKRKGERANKKRKQKMVSFISDLIEDAVILFSESLLLISVFFIGMLASVFFVLSALAIFLSFTTSLRSSWHKRRLQKTTLVAGRKDVSLFPKKLIDKKFEGLFRSTKPQFTKKELKEYMKLKKETEKRKEKEEEEGIEEGKDEEEGGEREIEGALSLLGAGVWIPRFAVLSLSGYLSFLSSSASDDDDCDLLGQIKLRGFGNHFCFLLFSFVFFCFLFFSIFFFSISDKKSRSFI